MVYIKIFRMYGGFNNEKKKAKIFYLPRRGFEPWILEQFVFYSGKSQTNLASYFGLIDKRMFFSDKKQPV